MSHRQLTVLGLAAALVVGLAACGDDPEPAAAPSPSASSPSPSASVSGSPSQPETTSGELPTVVGDFGEPPKVQVPAGAPPEDLVVKTLEKGKGPAVESGEIIVVDYLGVRWENGETFDSSFDRGSPAGFTIGTGAVIPGWDEALVGAPVGSRLLLVLPPDEGYADSPPEGAPIEPGDTLVFVVDVLGSHAPGETAKGEPAPTEDDSLPYVSISPREPDMVVPSGFDTPRRLIALPVVVGAGPKVAAGQTVVVQYKGVLWRNGKVFDSSWSSGQPFVTTIGASAVIPGWDKGLVGKTVGSRVLLVVPPKDGYGDSGNGQIRGTDTMVFAVDILGAY